MIVAAVEALPADLDDGSRADAQASLVGYAVHHDARELRILGNRILEVIAPEVGEAHEAKQSRTRGAGGGGGRVVPDGRGRAREVSRPVHDLLPARGDAEEAAARDRRTQTPRPGGRAGTGTRPPVRTPAGGGVRGVHRDLPHRPTPASRWRLGHRRGDHDRGHPDGWVEGSGAGHRPPDQPRPGPEARCRAGIIPAVLGTQSQVLDLGRRTRFHTEPQRIALALEQGGCTAEGCDWPPGMCHAHHDQPFSSGGATSVKNGRLLCPRHHARAHDPTYQTTTLPTGKVRFHRRT